MVEGTLLLTRNTCSLSCSLCYAVALSQDHAARLRQSSCIQILLAQGKSKPHLGFILLQYSTVLVLYLRDCLNVPFVPRAKNASALQRFHCRRTADSTLAPPGLFWLALARILALCRLHRCCCYLEITKAAPVLADIILGAIIPRKVEVFYISENKTDVN